MSEDHGDVRHKRSVPLANIMELDHHISAVRDYLFELADRKQGATQQELGVALALSNAAVVKSMQTLKPDRAR